jgi:hypothetical protein
MNKPLTQAEAFPDSARVAKSVSDALKAAERFEEPYTHWIVRDMLPAETVKALIDLPFPAMELEGVSGRRELHNDERIYFDAGNIEAHPVCKAVAEAFQAPETVAAVQAYTGAPIEGSWLRIEYAQDTKGFWLEPHTDLGVKKFTLLYYLADGPEQEALGTDIYRDKETWAKRPPFHQNTALVFVPSNNTWHGFEPRKVNGVRKSVIINYVTHEWRAREQLAFADPVRAA